MEKQLRTVFLLHLASLFLGTADGRAAARMNLLPQGDFTNPGARTGWAEGFNIPRNREFRVVSENGKSWLRIENRDAGRSLDYVHAYVRIPPNVTALTISARLKATDLKAGADWHDARIGLSFEGGSFPYPAEVPELKADSDWVTKSVELKVPEGAPRLNLQPALFHCTGVFEIADLAVTPHLVAATPLADAVLPEGVALDWDKTDAKPVNAKRARISLDGIWRFAPAAEGSAEPPELGWAYLKVPGNWQNRPGRRSDFVATGGGPQWDLYDGSLLERAWYERRVPIPADWHGRAISLRFDRVSTDAIICVNGIDCGRVSWPWGAVDITRAVTPGQTADIRVLVAAIADSELVGDFWQNAFMNVTYTAASLATRGLTGGVSLESRLTPGHVTDVFARPSTRKKQISLDVELAGVAQAGPLRFVAEMIDEQGAVEKTFTADSNVEARPTQTVSVSWPWTDPRLWDVERPNLYTLRLTVKGAGLDDQYDQPFGFREFWIEGRQFYLNGTVIHLRQPCFYNGPHPQVGDNFAEFGNSRVDARGDASDAGRELDRADRTGFLAAVYVLDANKYMRDSRGRLTWEQNQ